MINKFISELSPNGRKILIVAAFFVLLAAFDRLFLGPSLNKLKEIDDKIVNEESIVRQNIKFLSYRERVAREAGLYKDFYAASVRSEEEIIAEFLKKIELLATQSQVTLSKVSPSAQDYQKERIKYFVSIDCSGKLEDISNFVYLINNSRELLKVEKMNFAANNRDAEKIQATMTVSRMIIGGDPSQEARDLVKIKQEAPAAKAADASKKP